MSHRGLQILGNEERVAFGVPGEESDQRLRRRHHRQHVSDDGAHCQLVEAAEIDPLHGGVLQEPAQRSVLLTRYLLAAIRADDGQLHSPEP
jgi:hypothetical protein